MRLTAAPELRPATASSGCSSAAILERYREGMHARSRSTRVSLSSGSPVQRSPLRSVQRSAVVRRVPRPGRSAEPGIQAWMASAASAYTAGRGLRPAAIHPPPSYVTVSRMPGPSGPAATALSARAFEFRGLGSRPPGQEPDSVHHAASSRLRRWLLSSPVRRVSRRPGDRARVPGPSMSSVSMCFSIVRLDGVRPSFAVGVRPGGFGPREGPVLRSGVRGPAGGSVSGLLPCSGTAGAMP